MKKIILISLVTLLLVSCDKEVFTGLVESNITAFGQVFVSSNPIGYKLYMDNKYMDLFTPDSVPYVSEGIHRLTLKSDLFSDSTLTIDVKKSSPLSLSIDMMKSTRFYAKVICSTNPQGAKIFLNDQPTNLTTPTTLTNVYPGSIEIKFLKNQFRDDSLVVKIKGGEYSEIYRILEDTSRTVSYRMSNSKIFSNVINKVVVDKNNNKWIGSINHGLMKFDGKNWISYENDGVIDGKRVQDLLVDKTGRLWVGTSTGLSVFDGLSWISYSDKLPSVNVVALEEDVYGNIWIATFGGLVKYYNNTFRIFNSSNTDVSLANLSSLSSSKNGEIWVGSSANGIFKYNGTKWTQYVTNEMDLDRTNVSNIVKDLIVDSNGNLWSYSSSDPSLNVASALLKYNGTLFVDVNLPLLFGLDVNSFYSDNNGNLWMSVNGGLIKYNESQPLRVFDSDTNGFYSKQCTSFVIDLNGDGWLTTFGAGIAKLKKGTF